MCAGGASYSVSMVGVLERLTKGTLRRSSREREIEDLGRRNGGQYLCRVPLDSMPAPIPEGGVSVVWGGLGMLEAQRLIKW